MWKSAANTPDLQNIRVQTLQPAWLKNGVGLDVLRLDLIHPYVSGNKFFKLKFYLEEAKRRGHDTVATYGGAYSNHIAATACACSIQGLKSIGIIRGERPRLLSHTLQEAISHGMQLYFMARDAYRLKQLPSELTDSVYLVPEGGYGIPGMNGAAGIMEYTPSLETYTHIVVATGTGTTLAGITSAAASGQALIGISVLKGNYDLRHATERLLPEAGTYADFSILHDFHFGGYAKSNGSLLNFMRETWYDLGLPTDFVYTAKALFSIKALMAGNQFAQGSRILFIHTGGLQGNKSLPAGTLPF